VCDGGVMLMAAVWREPYAFWRFTRRDLPASLLPGTGFGLAAFVAAGHPRHGLPLTVLALVFYFCAYIYVFCLANQLTGQEEDAINKPDRPLVSGLVTPAWAQRRLTLLTILFPLTGLALGVFRWALLWLVLVLLYNYARWDRHWITKSAFILLGAIAMLAAAWEISEPLTPLAWWWILILSLPSALLIIAQDLRDMHGDRAVSRITLPLAIGHRATRLILCAAYPAMAVVVHFGLIAIRAQNTAAVLAFDAAQALVCLVIAVRLVTLRSKRADHFTYMLYTWWYTLVTFGAVLVFMS
jgi:4-hydroxybenzoate polyprenyltransferase